eukprot:CAMPEP_0196773274 /NCGR_PEP_ID=MMETSP1104-20130614/2674_1 /TAXON_ID=33652 /ORGANISM="Cafeteria sp., Strain Caron Lab Isolate" /LENGTH=452 /DNA_ID=CAMNT_0042143419 /DNA_START=29 /DNA_END=1384 /DNA_ORIENTATION=+
MESRPQALFSVLNVDTGEHDLPADTPSLRQQLILYLLAHVCAQHDTSPRLFVLNVLKWHRLGVLDSLSFLSDLGILPPSTASLGVPRPPPTSGALVQLRPAFETDTFNAAVAQLEAAMRAGAPGMGAVRPFAASRFQQEFEVLGRLGSGGFGSVYHVRHRLDGAHYAVKRVVFREHLLAGRGHVLDKVLREVRALARVDHPCITRYYGAWIEPLWVVDGSGSDAAEAARPTARGHRRGRHVAGQALPLAPLALPMAPHVAFDGSRSRVIHELSVDDGDNGAVSEGEDGWDREGAWSDVGDTSLLGGDNGARLLSTNGGHGARVSGWTGGTLGEQDASATATSSSGAKRSRLRHSSVGRSSGRSSGDPSARRSSARHSSPSSSDGHDSLGSHERALASSSGDKPSRGSMGLGVDLGDMDALEKALAEAEQARGGAEDSWGASSSDDGEEEEEE